jgi:hypothetical protein
VEIAEAAGLMRGLPLTLVALASLRSVIDFCTGIAQFTVSTALANSTSMPSPIVSTIHP